MGLSVNQLRALNKAGDYPAAQRAADQALSALVFPEFGRLVAGTIGQIEAAQFVAHSGIGFPQNGCPNCPHLGLCLNNQPLIGTNLVRKAGASDLDWLDELVD